MCPCLCSGSQNLGGNYIYSSQGRSRAPPDLHSPSLSSKDVFFLTSTFVILESARERKKNFVTLCKIKKDYNTNFKATPMTTTSNLKKRKADRGPAVRESYTLRYSVIYADAPFIVDEDFGEDEDEL